MLSARYLADIPSLDNGFSSSVNVLRVHLPLPSLLFFEEKQGDKRRNARDKRASASLGVGAMATLDTRGLSAALFYLASEFRVTAHEGEDVHAPVLHRLSKFAFFLLRVITDLPYNVTPALCHSGLSLSSPLFPSLLSPSPFSGLPLPQPTRSQQIKVNYILIRDVLMLAWAAGEAAKPEAGSPDVLRAALLMPSRLGTVARASHSCSPEYRAFCWTPIQAVDEASVDIPY